ncbi:MAG TPA: histidine kinase [Acetobacteraceae bacterium]|nr:histidine kinase [Acetobacteraceae bacterium]
MRRRDLKFRLMLWTVLLAAGCFAAAAAYVLVTADARAHAHAAWIAEVAAKDLELQQQQITWIATPAPTMPDLQNIAAPLTAPGVCILYRGAEARLNQRFCGGPEQATSPAPFASFYRWIFGADRAAVQGVFFQGREIGDVLVQLDPASLAAAAWQEGSRVLGVVAVTLCGLCALLYAALHRVLRPTRLIRAGLERLAENDLGARLPPFDLGELSAIGDVFNRLAERLQTTVAERDGLLRRLVTVQDDERRHLARELHDEFGQCLAAIAAMIAAMRQTALQDAPAMVDECDGAARIVTRMMRTLRGVLQLLRPPDIDELGLAESLRAMVAAWNGGGNATTRFQIELRGDCDALPPAFRAELYRIAQEAMTNAAKHARASIVTLRLAAPALSDQVREVVLSVEDNGTASPRAAVEEPGLGLLGMRERVGALGGILRLTPRQPHGLALTATFAAPDLADAA